MVTIRQTSIGIQKDPSAEKKKGPGRISGEMEPSFLLPGLYLQAATMFFLIHMWGGKVFDTQSACSQLGPSTAMFCTPPQLPCSLTFSYLSLFCLFVIISIYAVSLSMVLPSAGKGKMFILFWNIFTFILFHSEMNYSAIGCDFMVNDQYGRAREWGESTLPSSCTKQSSRVTSIESEQAVKRWKQQQDMWVQAMIIDNKRHNGKHLEKSHRCLQSHYPGSERC